MSRHKSKNGQNAKPIGHDQTSREEKSTQRHVYVEPGIKVDLVESLRAQHKTDQQENATHQSKQLFWTKIASGLLFITAGLAGWQGYSTKISANAAADAARISAKALTASNRSWIEARLAPPWDDDNMESNRKQLSDMKEIQIRFHLTNIGEIPITNLHAESAIEVLNWNESGNFQYLDPHVFVNASIVFPSRTFPILDTLFQPGYAHSAEQMTPELRNQLDTGQKYFIAYGKGAFDDAAGKHWFRYCRWIALETPMPGGSPFHNRACVDYNAYGDGEENLSD
jgi:hypothetical protein